MADEQKPPQEPPPSASYEELHRTALAAIDYCIARVPLECLSDVDVAEKSVNRLRDGLIADLRRAEPSRPREVLRPALDHANIALSLIVGVEYPATGSQRQGLEMARDTLKGIQIQDTI